jgi:hypothetical protein
LVRMSLDEVDIFAPDPAPLESQQERQRERKRERQTNRQTNRHTDIPRYRHTHTHTGTHTHTHTRTHAHTHTRTQAHRRAEKILVGREDQGRGRKVIVSPVDGHRQQRQPGSSGLQTHILTHRHTGTHTHTHAHTHTRTHAHRRAEKILVGREDQGRGRKVIVSPVIGSSGNPAAVGCRHTY